MARVREKTCDRCQTKEPVLYRVQISPSKKWWFVCDRCLPAIKEDNIHYTYGGTWKARKRH